MQAVTCKGSAFAGCTYLMLHAQSTNTPSHLQPTGSPSAYTGALTPADVYHGEGGLLQQLQRLHQVFQQQQLWHFFSASVLLVYEGQATAAVQARPAVRLIDFAHAFPTAQFRRWLAAHGGVVQQQQQQQQPQQPPSQLGMASTPPEGDRHNSSGQSQLQQVLAALAACQQECAAVTAAEPPSQVWEGCTAEGADENVCTALASLIQHIAAAAAARHGVAAEAGGALEEHGVGESVLV